MDQIGVVLAVGRPRPHDMGMGVDDGAGVAEMAALGEVLAGHVLFEHRASKKTHRRERGERRANTRRIASLYFLRVLCVLRGEKPSISKQYRLAQLAAHHRELTAVHHCMVGVEQ